MPDSPPLAETHVACDMAIVNERGERLVAVLPGSAPPSSAPAFSLALAVVQGRALLVRNARRGTWELPGGWIEPGESPANCALRELQEEAGCDGQALRLAAWIELETMAVGSRPATRLAGAVFAIDTPALATFVANDETTATDWWPVDSLPADTSAIDAWLVKHLART